jgi:N6-adenosine-specific RNA methylase IME4
MDGEVLSPPAALVRYDAARRALAEAVRIDDVKQIRDLAMAAQVYARQAQDFEMINNATELRERSERRAGEILIEMRERGERAISADMLSRGPEMRPRDVPKLADLGMTKQQSSRWQAKAKLPEEKFEKHVERVKRKAVEAAEKPTTEVKQQRRAEKEASLAEATQAASRALGEQIYGVIYADPPWRFEPYSRDSGMDRAADNHYPTMTLDGIKSLRIPAAPDCVLFLWATVPMLPQALDVMSAWGFAYRSHFVWVKHRIGTGYWSRNQHELLLIGTRGDIPAPAPGQQYASVIDAEGGAHSAKPFHFTEMIEDMFPHQARLEMFARGDAIVGWDRWGNET